MANQTRIVIADDQRFFADALAQALRSVGLEVPGVAYDAGSALQLLDEFRPDILLLEYELPGINGQNVVRIARQLRPDMRIVVLTANLSSLVQTECLQSGANTVITKELGLSAIAATLIAA